MRGDHRSFGLGEADKGAPPKPESGHVIQSIDAPHRHSTSADPSFFLRHSVVSVCTKTEPFWFTRENASRRRPRRAFRARRLRSRRRGEAGSPGSCHPYERILLVEIEIHLDIIPLE